MRILYWSAIIMMAVWTSVFGWYNIERYISQDLYSHPFEGTVYEDRNGNGLRDEGEMGVEGVGVSDGREVVVTDKLGRYSLSNTQQDANVVFITVPSHYRKDGNFYYLLYSKDSKREFNFGICPSEESRDFSFIQITDGHMFHADRIPDFILNVQAMETEFPQTRLVINTGDIGTDNRIETLIRYKGAITGKSMIWKNVMGNHDEIYQDDYTQSFRYALGPDYYSFDYAGRHFILLNSMHLDDHKMNTDWFINDMEKLGRNKPTLIFMHFHPKPSHFALWKTYPSIQGVFSGHWHGIKNLEIDGIRSYNTSPYRFGGTDYTPAGFRRGVIRNDSLTVTYHFFRNPEWKESTVALYPDDCRHSITHEQAEAMGNWTTFMGNESRRGRCSDALKIPMKQLWKTQLEGMTHIASPVIAQGRVFITTRDFDRSDENYLVALTLADGQVIWKKKLVSPVTLCPAVAGDLLVMQDQCGRVLAVDFQGNTRWEYDDNAALPIGHWIKGVPIVSNDTVWVGNLPEMAALQLQTGQVIWKKTFGDYGIFSNAILSANDRMLITGSIWSKYSILAVNKQNGEIIRDLKSAGISNAAIWAGNQLWALDFQGILSGWDVKNWQKTTDYKMERSPWSVITPASDGKYIYMVTGGGRVVCYNSDKHQEEWNYELGAGRYRFIPYHDDSKAFSGSPLYNARYLWVGTSDGIMHVLDRRSGQPVQKINLGSPITGTPAVVGPIMVVSTWDGRIQALTAEK